ncbi:energy transducer TonB, partial [Brevundimonas sp.]|uniref:energy transducer TonB n=1 Tax=Brevundimonas sp. TaxID=1871086 RepID=UPI0025E58B94
MLMLALALTLQDPTPPPISNPVWLQRPSGSDLARYAPQALLDEGLSGRTVIRCIVNEHGRLEDCTVAEETPAGRGFGEASLRLVSRFRMRSETADGVPVEGGSVSIPITWQMGESEPPRDPGVPTLMLEDLAYCAGLARAWQAAEP